MGETSIDTSLGYVVKRMCQSRGVEFSTVERLPGGSARFRIHKAENPKRSAWCAVDGESLQRNKSEAIVEAVALALALGIDELQGAPKALAFDGKFRVHFNHHGAAPLVWCVATDAWELAVSGIEIDARVTTSYKPKATPDHEDGRPSAWLEVDGVLIVTDGIARITRRAA